MNVYNTLMIPASIIATQNRIFESCMKEINSNVNEIEKWSRESNLIFNAKKTKSILFCY